MKWQPLWHYIFEREKIRLKKLSGRAWPWTDDKILQTYKFTNVKRIHDATTQAFLHMYSKHKNARPEVALLNCAARRFTGTAEMSQTMGWLTRLPTLSAFRKFVEECPRPWTGAYMIRADRPGMAKADVVQSLYLARFWKRARDITEAINRHSRWEDGYHVMRECYGFGPFMAKEVLQDYILWLACNSVKLEDEGTFTPIGPGGRRGLNRLNGRPLTKNIGDEKMLREIIILLAVIQPKWKETFYPTQELTAHDIQFCLCEYDKYERTRLGEGRPRSTYTYVQGREED